jgi:hypothetical protein
MFQSKRTIIRPTYKNLVYEWMDKAFEISEGIYMFTTVGVVWLSHIHHAVQKFLSPSTTQPQ